MAASGGTILYRDRKFGFTLKFPEYWRRYTVMSRKNDMLDAEYTVHFIFKYRGKTYGPVLSVIVFRMTRKEWVDQGYEDSPLRFIAEHDKHVFAYDTPEELPSEFIDKKTGDYDYVKYGKQIRLMKRMVNRDVPLIVKTMRFPVKKVTLEPSPYLSKRIKVPRC
ncbi:hypothetical protein [Paenibacillus hamazuiensis]|uniref:hypothetical protein n=1 Tax=Paenibacillus hamazuiensis TaxID=2936508 RepID=UPI00200E32A8|nr:hypothetical protein [Paenibacillus hamazuiensis]